MILSKRITANSLDENPTRQHSASTTTVISDVIALGLVNLARVLMTKDDCTSNINQTLPNSMTILDI